MEMEDSVRFAKCETPKELRLLVQSVLDGIECEREADPSPWLSRDLDDGTLRSNREIDDNEVYIKEYAVLAHKTYSRLKKQYPQLPPLSKKTQTALSELREIHRCCITAEAPNGDNISKPLPKIRMMNALGIDSYETFNAFAARHGLEKISRKLYRIRLDKMDRTTREKLEKA